MKSLEPLVQTITTQAIREAVTEFLATKVPSYFPRIPASSSGKYHPKYCLGDGGLLRHTIAATKILNHILSLDFAKETFTELQRDKMRAAIILHDTFKQGDGVDGHTVPHHEILAANAFNEFMGLPSTNIGQLMKCHMGQWSDNKPSNLGEFIVHLADYLASRKEIEVSMET